MMKYAYSVSEMIIRYSNPYPYDPSSSTSGNKRKAKLMNEYNRKCFYCKSKVVLQNNLHNINKYPDNLATVDHVYSKYDIRRALSKKKVLCCLKCNRQKGFAEDAYMKDQKVSVNFNVFAL